MGLLVTTAAAYQPVGSAPDRLGTDIRMTATPTGELDVASRGPFLSAERLRVGRRASGRLSVRNQTGATLSVTVRATSSLPGFADRLHVRMHAGDETVADGTLHNLTTGSRPWLLESGRTTDLRVEAWMAPTGDGYQADEVHVDLRFETQLASS